MSLLSSPLTDRKATAEDSFNVRSDRDRRRQQRRPRVTVARGRGAPEGRACVQQAGQC